MVTNSACLGFLGLGLEESGSSGRTHSHVVSGGIKCERGLKEHSLTDKNHLKINMSHILNPNLTK